MTSSALRLNGEDGLGAIFPAMVNALEVMVLLGYPADDPRRVTAKKALQKLLVVDADMAYCQPCVSPIWDTGLSALALQEVGCPSSRKSSVRALDWLKSKQLRDEPGDWRVSRPDLAGGGWAFQFANGHYPDLDDTAVVAWGMHQAGDEARYGESMTRALDWLVGMQSSNGGFAAFDVDNTHYYLNFIPFADHGALLDPPTSDVTARIVTLLARVGRPQDREALARAIDYLRREQEADGSWFGRWGTNYIYGTWSVLMALACRHKTPACSAPSPGSRVVRTTTAVGVRATIRTCPRRRRWLSWRVPPTRLPGPCWVSMRWARADPRLRIVACAICCGGRRRTASGKIRASRRRGFRAYFICAITAIPLFSHSGHWPPIG
jgi:squalene/oxidosqualene cyclase-like protein